MASSDQRDNERVPTFLRVRLKFADIDTFIEKYSTNVSLGGIFIQSRSPKPQGTNLRFELALESGEPIIRGEGQVTWVKEFDANTPGQPFGMGVRFTNLDSASRAVVERAVARRQGRAGGDAGFSPTPPPNRGRAAARAERNSPQGVRNADAEIEALMRECGLDEQQLAQAAARAARIIGSDDLPAGLRALLDPASPAVRPAPRAPTPPSAPPIVARPPSPPPAPVEPARSRKRTPAPVEPIAQKSRRRGSKTTPPPQSAAPADAAPSSEPEVDELERALEAALTPAPIPHLRDEPEPPDFDRAGSTEVDNLEGTNLSLESLDGLPAPPEITAVGTPPRFEETEEDPDLFPDRELLTPPPESAPPLFEENALLTPPQAPSSGAVDRWAAASGPETANLDADLIAAMDSVIDHGTGQAAAADAEVEPPQPAPAIAPPAPVAAPTPAPEVEKKGKSLLGRLFRKKS